jgi:hypothetical protein
MFFYLVKKHKNKAKKNIKTMHFLLFFFARGKNKFEFIFSSSKIRRKKINIVRFFWLYAVLLAVWPCGAWPDGQQEGEKPSGARFLWFFSSGEKPSRG